MDHSTHNKIVSFIWSIADDCLRDVFVRGKYRDVILPMFVLRRLDVLLEPTKAKVLEEVHFQRVEAGFNELEPQGLCDASGYVFFNTSQFTLKALLGNPSQLEANFKNYIDGFSANVKEIITHFDLRNLSRKMATADVLHDVIEKFVSEEINLGPEDKTGPDGRPQPGLSNLGMGYVFEELIRRFNEENNEEAGEHFTPREVIELMTHIIFMPIKEALPPVITIYDPACGSGGMLTEAQNFIIDPEGGIKATADTYLYGKEVNGETYAICKSDMMIKGNSPENIRYGSTLASDEFAGTRFDFMLSNPPYGKSWKTDQKYIKDGKDVIDPRFEVSLKNYDGSESTEAATPRSSDGQLLFLMEMVNKMKSLSDSPNGSRIASVHNGSSLFTGDAGSGESNIRRYIIENDWLEAIVQLPTNLFYNTGITTYIWVLSNNKAPARKGKVQLIDASQLHRKLRKNLGQKNCEFAPEHIKAITDLYLQMPHDGVSKVFANSDFGYHKVTVERPLRLKAQFTLERLAPLRFVSQLEAVMRWAYGQYGDAVYEGLSGHKEAILDSCEREGLSLKAKDLKRLIDAQTWLTQRELLHTAEGLMHAIGQEAFYDFNAFSKLVDEQLKAQGKKLSASEKKQMLSAISDSDEAAAPVIKKQHKIKGEPSQVYSPDFGYWPTDQAGVYLEYETDADLRDAESIPLSTSIHDYFLSEVRPHVADAWLNMDSVKIGYEISFNKYFYKHTPLRSLEIVTAEILALEQETEGLLKEIVGLSQV